MSDAVKIDFWFFIDARMTELPFDTLTAIAGQSPAAWRAMLAVPSFARWTSTPAGRRWATGRFVETVTVEGGTCTLLDGRQHSFWGQPAVVWVYGQREWYHAGRLHRDDGPAGIWADGTQAWYRNGRRHRDDGPAIVWVDGGRAWYRDGQLHRDDGPAVVWADGDQEWYCNGRKHRDDGPAVVLADGRQEWWRDGVKYDPNA